MVFTSIVMVKCFGLKDFFIPQPSVFIYLITLSRKFIKKTKMFSKLTESIIQQFETRKKWQYINIFHSYFLNSPKRTLCTRTRRYIQVSLTKKKVNHKIQVSMFFVSIFSKTRPRTKNFIPRFIFFFTPTIIPCEVAL